MNQVNITLTEQQAKLIYSALIKLEIETKKGSNLEEIETVSKIVFASLVAAAL